MSPLILGEFQSNISLLFPRKSSENHRCSFQSGIEDNSHKIYLILETKFSDDPSLQNSKGLFCFANIKCFFVGITKYKIVFIFIINFKLQFVLSLNNIESFYKNMRMGSKEERRISNNFVLPCSFFWTSIQTGTGRLHSLGRYLNDNEWVFLWNDLPERRVGLMCKWGQFVLRNLSKHYFNRAAS